MEAFPKGISVINKAIYSPAGIWEYAMPAYNNPPNITAIDGELELFVHEISSGHAAMILRAKASAVSSSVN